MFPGSQVIHVVQGYEAGSPEIIRLPYFSRPGSQVDRAGT
jgi:hypothetical protein